MAEREQPDFEIVNGTAEFAARAEAMVAAAYMEVLVMTQELDRRIYGSESFVSAVRKFALQHAHARMRILVSTPQAAIQNNPRMVEFGRRLSSQIEFRELQPERRGGVPYEYVITDGRLLLFRETPMDLQAKYYGNSPPAARLQMKDYDVLWNESEPAQELRNLQL